MTAHTRIEHMTGAERVGEFEAFAERIRARHPKPEVAPYFISQADIARNTAEQRVLGMLDRTSRAYAAKHLEGGEK